MPGTLSVSSSCSHTSDPEGTGIRVRAGSAASAAVAAADRIAAEIGITGASPNLQIDTDTCLEWNIVVFFPRVRHLLAAQAGKRPRNAPTG